MDDIQEALNKYKSKFDDLIKEIENDELIKSMEGNGLCGVLEAIKNDIDNHLEENKKKPN